VRTQAVGAVAFGALILAFGNVRSKDRSLPNDVHRSFAASACLSNVF
jgi:hypothetical protein